MSHPPETYKTATRDLRDRWIGYIHGLQDRICAAVEAVDGKACFATDEWDREGGGGGRTRTIAAGDVFEKGGVNTSVVWGKVTDTMRAQLNVEGHRWFAAGLSLVLHPGNPYVPTTHANW
ncbi:MAG TPA: coproporphyrinogen III oxidase, partial [Puia sp.]|nr:coproporphyrinogen III oxidase [Puia sp.]